MRFFNRLVFISGLLGFYCSALAAPPKSTPALLQQAKKTYTTVCAACHGEKGDGAGPTGKILKPTPRNFISDKFKAGDTPEAIFKVITDGLPGTMMTGYKYLGEQERWGLAYYVKSFKK